MCVSSCPGLPYPRLMRERGDGTAKYVVPMSQEINKSHTGCCERVPSAKFVVLQPHLISAPPQSWRQSSDFYLTHQRTWYQSTTSHSVTVIAINFICANLLQSHKEIQSILLQSWSLQPRLLSNVVLLSAYC